jgi:cystathionine gamma-synthase
MQTTPFVPIKCGQTLPLNNVHAVSVSMPTLKDVIDYEECEPCALEQIQSGYPRFILHPYLKMLAQFIEKKYAIDVQFEVVLLSSKKAVKQLCDTYFIKNQCDFDEPFGVILVQKNTSQLQKVLMYIQHVGCNLSSRLAEGYLYENGIITKLHEEERIEKNAKEIVLDRLSKAYAQPKQNICLAPSGMNAIYSVLKGIKAIQRLNGRNVLVQFGWLYLDTMNIVSHHFERSKTFYDIENIEALKQYLQKEGLKVSAIVTEVPTNPLLKCVDIAALKSLCNQYNIPLIIDATLATPYNIDLKPYADIYVESLTKYACGNADVLMGAYILNENSALSYMNEQFMKHTDTPYIKDVQRLAFEIQGYEKRMKSINQNTKKLIEYLQQCPYIKKVYHCMSESSHAHYAPLMLHEDAYAGILSVTFTCDFARIYDALNFAKGPSLGTEFTLLMPYVYLAHYDCIVSKQGQAWLEKHGLPVDLLRISVGCEPIEDIINEFKRVEKLVAKKD